MLLHMVAGAGEEAGENAEEVSDEKREGRQ